MDWDQTAATATATASLQNRETIEGNLGREREKSQWITAGCPPGAVLNPNGLHLTSMGTEVKSCAICSPNLCPDQKIFMHTSYLSQPSQPLVV